MIGYDECVSGCQSEKDCLRRPTCSKFSKEKSNIVLIPEKNSEQFSLELSFINQSEDYVLGWEARGVYDKLQNSKTSVDYTQGFPLHYKNREQYLLMCISLGFEEKEFKFTSGDQTYYYCVFEKVENNPENSRRFFVVK